MSDLKDAVIAALRTVRDPEIPVNLYDLGLIYGLDVGDDGAVRVRMMLTTPNCPVADALPGQVRNAVEGIDGVSRAEIELVWDPPWTPAMMSEDAKLHLEMMGVDFADPRAPGGPFTALTFGRESDTTGRRE
jgi:FeS assembly SUF system protein